MMLFLSSYKIEISEQGQHGMRAGNQDLQPFLLQGIEEFIFPKHVVIWMLHEAARDPSERGFEGVDG